MGTISISVFLICLLWLHSCLLRVCHHSEPLSVPSCCLGFPLHRRSGVGAANFGVIPTNWLTEDSLADALAA